MEEDFIILVDYDNICRLCLQSTGAMSDIFAEYGEKSMQQQIFVITGLATKEGDGLPSKICHRCRHVVEQASELRDVVHRSTEILTRTAFTSEEDQTELDKQNESNQYSGDDDDDAATVIIENIENGTQDDFQDETIIEEYNIYPECNANDSEEIIDKKTTHLKENIVDKVPVITKSFGRKFEELICQVCLEKFDSREKVRPHVEKHYAGSGLQIYLDITCRPYTCTVCNEDQLNRPQLVKHHRRHLGINPYKCKHPGCSYEGKDRDGIRHHKVIHSAPSRVCLECGSAFRRRTDLVSHTLRLHPHTDQALLTKSACSSCGFKARNEPALRQHMKAHHYAPRFPCPYGSCARGYRSARALAAHERAHRGARRYSCPLCNAHEFTATSSLRRHMSQHERSVQYLCGACPLACGDPAALSRHRAAHHAPHAAHAHTCRACEHVFQSEAQLNEHKETCEQLNLFFSNKQELTQNGQTDSQESMDE